MADGGPSPAVNKALVLKSIWHYSAAIVLTYWVTFTLFPGSLTEDVASQALGDWYGILLITAYNLSDLAGRVASNYLLVARKTVLGLAVGRIALVPLFWLANRAQAGEPAMFTLALALGASNGYLTSLAMGSAPMGLPAAEAELAGMFMVLSLLAGCQIGSFSALLWLV